jgi:hypothetical protein
MRIRLSVTILLGLMGLVLAACGGDGEPAPGSAAAPLRGTPQDESSGAGRTNEADAAAGKANGTSEDKGESATPGYQDLLAQQTAKPQERFTPCNLVSPGEARSILGTELQPPLEAPQGPTCIYRPRRGDDTVTLAVESRSLADLRRTIRKPQRIQVAGRTGYCDARGQGRLWVPLAQGRVLSVGAGCDIAQQFASAAVRRIGA